MNSQLPRDAKTDLAGNISGDFSPEDWEKIFARAMEQVRGGREWVEVIRDFHRGKYWGFVPNYKKPKPKPHEENLGKRFIWYSVRSFLLTKVIVLYCGARYSADDPNPIYKWGFFGGIAFILIAYARFLWKYGGRKEE